MSFHRWFSGSVAVEEAGGPLRVYHGTNQAYSDFDPSRIGANTKAASSVAFFFTEDPREAAEYADLASRTQIVDAPAVEKRVDDIKALVARAEARNDWDRAEALYAEWEALELGAINEEPSGQNIRPSYLRVCRPLVIDMQGAFDGHAVLGHIRAAKRAGHDGLKLLNVFDPVCARREPYVTTQWVVFKPSQVRTALVPDSALEPRPQPISRPSRGLEALLGGPSP